MADRVTSSHSGAGPKRIKQSAKRSRPPLHHATTSEHDMGAFQDLPLLTNLGPLPLLTPPTQNIVSRSPLPRHVPFTPRDESDNGESDPEREFETQPPQTQPPQSQTQPPQTQTQNQTQTQPPPHIQTSEIGSSSTLNDPRIIIAPCGDAFYPNSKTIEDIGNAIKTQFGEAESNWKKVKPEQRKLWFEDFKKKYKWAKSDDYLIRKNFEKCGSGKYRSMMKEVRKVNSQPLWMRDAAYRKLSDYWRTPDFGKKSDQAKLNRNEDAGSCMQTTGSKPHSVVWIEMKAKNGGVDPPMDEYFSRTHKYQKGSNIGNWVSQQSQSQYESFTKLKQEIASSSAREFEGSEQDEGTRPTMPSYLQIYSQSVGGKKKGRVPGMGSLGRAMDSTFSLQSTQFPCPLFDNPIIVSMKTEMENLRTENKTELENLRTENKELKQQQETMNNQLQQLLHYLPNLKNMLSYSSTQAPHGDKNSTGP